MQLFNTLHLHWGSAAQTPDECDPTLPKSSALWCSQDGAVTYEPLLSEALKTDLFAALNEFIPILQQTTVAHCTAQDPTTGLCTASVNYDGVHVLSEAVRALVDPARSAALGLTDRHGSTTVVRNDGTTNPQVTPIYLLIDALKGMDQAFANYATANRRRHLEARRVAERAVAARRHVLLGQRLGDIRDVGEPDRATDHPVPDRYAQGRPRGELSDARASTGSAPGRAPT